MQTRAYPNARVVHALPHRVHLRAPALAGQREACRNVASRLARHPRYARIDVRPSTGSIFIESEDGPLDPDALVARVSRLVGRQRDEEGHLLTALRADRHPGPTRVARAVAHAVVQINEDVSASLDHRVDLGSILPVAFAAGGVYEVAATRTLPPPAWFNLLWWSLRSFMTFNVSAVEAETRASHAEHIERASGREEREEEEEEEPEGGDESDAEDDGDED